MRILVLTNLYPNPLEPGRAPFNRHQIAALAQEHDVRVIAPVAWVDEWSARVRGLEPIPYQRRVALDGIVVDHPRYRYTPRVLRNFHGYCYRWSVASCFRRVASELRPDVVFATWAYPDGWAAVHLARSAGLPIVVKVHGCDVLCGGRGLHSDRGRLVKTVQCLCAADAVVAVSRDLARNVASLGVPAERIHTVYNGVDSRIFHSGPADAARAKLELPDGERIILFVGRFDPVKGLDVLLKSCVLLMATGLRFKCYLVGDGPLRAELTAQVAALGLRDVVVMPGARDQAQLGDWYRSADVVVLPSRSEGVPNVLLEAAACGASFVASRVGGIEEIADRVPSRLVPPCDASALCHAIQELLVHRPAMKRLPAAPPRGHLESARELAALFDRVKHGHRYAAHAMPQTAMGGICNPTPENA